MTDYSKLKAKINDLSIKVDQNSITPTYLGSLLDEIADKISEAEKTAAAAATAAGTKATRNEEAIATERLARVNADAALQEAVDAAVGDISALGDSLDVAREDISSLGSEVEIIKGAMPPRISLGGLDAMGTDGSFGAMAKLANALGAGDWCNTRYAVESNGRIVGALDLFTDDAGHVLTQVFVTHCTLSDGAFYGHNCGALQRWWRSYNIASPQDIGADRGQWTPWKPVDAQPVEVATEAELERMIAAGECGPDRVYFTAEES